MVFFSGLGTAEPRLCITRQPKLPSFFLPPRRRADGPLQGDNAGGEKKGGNLGLADYAQAGPGSTEVAKIKKTGRFLPTLVQFCVTR